MSVINNTFTGASAPVFLCPAVHYHYQGKARHGKAKQGKVGQGEAMYIKFAYLEHLSYLCGAKELVIKGLR